MLFLQERTKLKEDAVIGLIFTSFFGLGLFLVVNVARTLGGTVTARNRVQGGAVVHLALPLAAIKLERESDHHAG